MSFITFRAACGAVAVASVALLAGCASDIMKNYIGQPVETVILDYGPPSTILDIGRGERAYQWRKVSTNVVPGSTSGEIKDTRRGTRYEETVRPGLSRSRNVSTHSMRAGPRGAGMSPISASRSWNANETPEKRRDASLERCASVRTCKGRSNTLKRRHRPVSRVKERRKPCVSCCSRTSRRWPRC